MHIEILTEDSSGSKILEILLPKIIGPHGKPHTWRVHAYKGIGRIPAGLQSQGDPSKRILLDQLPKLLRGYGKTPGIDAVVVVVDTDDRDCVVFLTQLKAVAPQVDAPPTVLFRLAMEETDAWYLGDRGALLAAFPRARHEILNRYVQDSVCGTWELLADAVHAGGSPALKKAGWPLSGQMKHDWAERIGPLMNIEINQSPSFGKLRDGLRRLVAGVA